jgi:alkylhydroperoxidase family enzyme
MVAREHPSEEEYQELLRHFDEKELVNLTLVISTINAWNRISIGLGAEPEKN